jgi:carbon monoxide dehydrogenase subunit G
MKIDHEFTVHAPIDRAWELLTDVEAIAPCMPGAQLTGIQPGTEPAAAETYQGKVKVKIGPVVSEFKGTAVFVEKDDAAHRGVIDAKGRDTRGAGNASATITMTLSPAGTGTTVAIDTDLKISGKVAQFGAGMIKEVSEKLLGQFVTCLESKLAAPPEVAEPLIVESAPAQVPEPVSVPASASAATASAELNGQAVPQPQGPTSTQPITPITPVARVFQAQPEPEALDLLDLAGSAAFKRLAPVAVAGVVVVAAVVIYLLRR